MLLSEEIYNKALSLKDEKPFVIEGHDTYLRLKENQFIIFGRNWDKMVKRITKNLIIKRHDKH